MILFIFFNLILLARCSVFKRDILPFRKPFPQYFLPVSYPRAHISNLIGPGSSRDKLSSFLGSLFFQLASFTVCQLQIFAKSFCLILISRIKRLIFFFSPFKVVIGIIKKKVIYIILTNAKDPTPR